MNGGGKSDKPVVPGKLPNKGSGAPMLAEGVEERGLAKGNSVRQNSPRAQERKRLQSALDRIQQKAAEERELRFTTLWHHVYDKERLRESFLTMKRKTSAADRRSDMGRVWEIYRGKSRGLIRKPKTRGVVHWTRSR